jgi:hypothetical protein
VPGSVFSAWTGTAASVIRHANIIDTGKTLFIIFTTIFKPSYGNES